MTTRSKKIFNLQLDKIVNDAITSAGGFPKGILVKQTGSQRTGGVVTSTEERHGFQGTERKRATRDVNGVVTGWEGEVSIMGASLPTGIIPEVNDVVIFLDDAGNECECYTLKELIYSSSAGVSFKFRVA